MAKVEFSSEQRQVIIRKLQTYLAEEMDHEAGRFETEFLLDYFIKEIGGHFYNQGLADAKAILEAKLQQIDDDLYEIEIPTDFS
jgi:uncharacterized protein (DUF2164 family)